MKAEEWKNSVIRVGLKLSKIRWVLRAMLSLFQARNWKRSILGELTLGKWKSKQRISPILGVT